MNIELRKVKFHEHLSDETNCFEAELWVDGEKLADVLNRGQGGENEYRVVRDPTYGQNNPKWAAFVKYCKAQPPHFYNDGSGHKIPLPSNTELVVDDLLQKWLTRDDDRRAQAQIKRWCKTQTVFRLKGDEKGRWRTVKAPYSERVKQYLTLKYGDKIESIANEGGSTSVTKTR